MAQPLCYAGVLTLLQCAMQFPDFKKGRVLVAGDLMLDRYWFGETARISPEAPVPVVRVNDSEERPGGAGNVALNLAQLGARVQILGALGGDEAGETLTQRLSAAGVDCSHLSPGNQPTITKLRVLSRHQQLLRLDFEPTREDPAISQGFPLKVFEQALEQADVVVLSDYGKGALGHPEALIQMARSRGRPVLIDPKGHCFDKYRGATIITPNRPEFEAITGPLGSDADLVQAAERLIDRLQLEAILVTRGAEGMTLVRLGQPPRHLPTKAREVFDVTGAGDTVIATLAAALAAGESMGDAATLANLAAGVVVGKLGTATVTVAELDAAVQEEIPPRRGVLSPQEALNEVLRARQRGETVVLTNGCFDLLHPGHVDYLVRARALGDRLIVLVNSDESVRRLKGPERPINSLPHRMALLAALSAVDWVAPFEEDTPEAFIKDLLPDILVKGGDYAAVDQIAGHEAVLARGGRVEILDFLEGHSTTALVDRIQHSGALSHG